MVEMEAIRAELRAEGMTDETLIYFAAVCRHEERHKDDETFREKQERWRREGRPWSGAARAGPSQADLYKEALQKIADGHNDARALAKLVLGQ